jgi:hypothetical protein
MVKSVRRVDLEKLFGGLQTQLSAVLQSGRDAFSHPGAKGAVTEEAWRQLLSDYLPTRYQVRKGFVIDHKGRCSDEIDILVIDRHYSPFLLTLGTGLYVPAESVYAAFEVKQTLNVENLDYASDKIESVRKLFRTSAPIVNMGKTSKPRRKFPILGGILTTSSDWSPAFGKSFSKHLKKSDRLRKIDIGFCMDAGGFELVARARPQDRMKVFTGDNSLVVFLLSLLNRLQSLGTVPAIKFDRYLSSID